MSRIFDCSNSYSDKIFEHIRIEHDYKNYRSLLGLHFLNRNRRTLLVTIRCFLLYNRVVKEHRQLGTGFQFSQHGRQIIEASCCVLTGETL